MIPRKTVQNRSPRTDPSQRAFTLLELMLALALVAFLIPILYNSLRSGFRDKAEAEAVVEPPRTAELAMDWLRTDLANALPPSTSTRSLVGPSSSFSAFNGTDGKDDRGDDGDDLKYFTTADSPLHDINNSEIKAIELAVITAPNGQHVLVRYVIRDLIAAIPPNPDVEVICRGIDGFNVRYFDGSNWTDTWDSTEEDNVLPAAVEITLTLNRPNGPSMNADGQKCFRFVRVIPLSCSTAPYDTNVNSGSSQ